jgi:hypothetical protein
LRYLTENWSFDPFAVVVAAVLLVHEIGLANLRRRSVPSRTITRRRRSYLFYAGLACCCWP